MKIFPSDLTYEEKALLEMITGHLRNYKDSHAKDEYQIPNFQSGIMTGMGMMLAEIERLSRG